MEAEVAIIGLDVMISANAVHANIPVAAVKIQIGFSRYSKLDMNALEAKAETAFVVAVKP